VHSATEVHSIVSWVGYLLLWSALERIGDKEKSFARLPRDVSQNYLFFIFVLVSAPPVNFHVKLESH
jgi:hypothetical protein